MDLVNYMIKDLLPEKQDFGRTVAAYGGGFKPATKGHFEVVKQALKQNPDIDEFIIFVGGKERDGITKEEATLIWDLYEKYLPMGKIKIISNNKPPIKSIYNYASDNPTEKVLFILGAREGNEDDFKDITDRTKALDNYPNMSLRTIVTQQGASGTAARNALKVSYEKFQKFLPSELSEDEKKMIYNMLSKKYVAESLEDWFEKEDWVRINTSGNITGPCGTMKKGKPTTRCLPRKKAQSLTKAERKATVAKKVRGSKKGKQFVKNTKKGKVKLKEGKYDSLVTQLSGFTLNAWKGDFEDNQKIGKFEIEIGPGKELDYPHLDFKYNGIAKFGKDSPYKTNGVARPFKPEVEITFTIPSDELPRMWSQIAMDLRNVIRHEIEHLMQAGPNVKKGKEMDSDQAERAELRTGKKPWWKIWRSTLGTPDYYKLEKEIDANLQGLYLKAKKSRQPLEDVVDNYLRYELNLSPEDREDIKALWKQRASKLSIPLEEGRKKKKDPKKGTGKKPEGSSRRLYTDEDPKDTIGIKFSTRQDIVNTLAKKSFKAKSHARQSQIINLIHQRVRAALGRTKDPKKKKRLQTAFKYILKRKEASKAKTKRLNKQKNENVAPNHKGKAAPYGSGYKKFKLKTEKKGFGKSGNRYRAIYKKDGKFYYMQDNPFSPGIRQEFGPFKTKAAAKRKMGSFPPGTSYRDITEYISKLVDEGLCKRGYNYIASRKRKGEKHNPFLVGRAVKVCKGQMSGSDGKQKKDFRPKKGKKRSAQGRKPDIVKEIGINLSNYDGQILPGDVLRAPKGFPLGGKKLEKSLQLKVIKNSREGVNRYKLSLEDKDGKKYSVRNFEMDGEYQGKKLPKWGLVRKSKKNMEEGTCGYDRDIKGKKLKGPGGLGEGDTYEKMAAKGKKSGNLKQGTVRKRLGIPKDKKIPLSLINKEISRLKKMDKDPDKKGAQLGDKNQKYYKALQLAKTLKTTTNLNEALDPKTFDFTPHIKSLTTFMEDNGLKLQPYPKIRFIHSDVDNGTNLLGRTAYYTPDNNEIVLYTYGRHPKDILRSYAHELVHVHQNMEDRLEHTHTTNVNQDDYLKELEKEAYETGNILFRSWSDTIVKEDARKISQKNYADYHKDNKKKVKDPFGIMAYAAELGRLREDETPNLKVYLDMDGVLADFNKRFNDLSGMLPQPFVNKYGLKSFWDLIDEKHKVAFWRGIEVMPGAKALVDAAKEYDYELLTAPSAKKQSRIGKNLWVQDKVGSLFGSMPKVNFRKAKEKHMIKPTLTKNDVLIDDRADTIERWERAGGTGIQYFTANQAIKDLRDLKV